MTKLNQSPVPGPLVVVDKKYGRKVGLALVDGNRMFLHGFETDFPAPVNFRIMRHGNFSVMVLADQPVELRVMMDGKLLAEHRLDPLPQPVGGPEHSSVKRQVREMVTAPQPFFITFADNNAPFTFAPDPEGRSLEERVRMQLYPQAIEPAEGPTMHLGVNPEHIGDEVFDVDPASLGLTPATPRSLPSDDAAPAAAGDDATISGAVAGNTASGEHDHAHETDEVAEGEGQVSMHTSTVDQTDGSVVPSDIRLDAPVPENWAPSHGLLAIGVRMIQVQTEGEPMLPPDGFQYVLFQMNTFEESAAVRANLHSRIRIAPKVAYRELDDKHHEHAEALEELGHRGCGHTHNHDPRRFR